MGCYLATKGPLPLSILAQRCRLSIRHASEALFILIQHNLVKYYLSGDEGSPLRPVLYRLMIDEVIGRLLYPLYAALLPQRFVDDAKAAGQVFLEVVKHGRLLMSLLPEDLLPMANRLHQEGFVKLVSPQHSMYRTDVDEPATTSLVLSSPSKGHPPGNPSTDLTLPSPTPKRPRYASPFPEQASSLDPSSSYLCINSAVLIDALGRERLIDNVVRRTNAAAGEIMRAALACVGRDRREATFTPFQITTRLPAHTEVLVDHTHSRFPSAIPSDKTPVMHYLDSLSQDIDYFVKEDFRSGGVYSVNFSLAVRRLRTDLIEALIRARFGQPSARIFRVLLDRKMLEEKTISKVAMMTAKETRERLYQLLQYGIVHMQEVPKTADHAPSRTFFLWTVPLTLVVSRLSELALKMWINLRERAELQKRKNELLILKSERSDVVANPALLAESERRQLHNLQRILRRLDFHGNRIAEDLFILCFLNE